MYTEKPWRLWVFILSNIEFGQLFTILEFGQLFTSSCVLKEAMKFYLKATSSVTNHIHLFPMLVATGSFSPERGHPVIFCVDFNLFKSIIMSALLHRKTLICSFLNQFRLLFICYQRKCNLLKPSLWICHSKALKHD